MKMLRQSARYFYGFPSLKKIVVIFVSICLISAFVLNWSNHSCNVVKTLQHHSDHNEISEQTLERLKQKWLGEQQENLQEVGVDNPDSNSNLQSISPVECLINDDYPIQCLQSNDNSDNIYMPFSFIEKYFDVTGKLQHYDGYNRFEFLQSYSKIVFQPNGPYSYHGSLMTFNTYNVEIRPTVKCISGIKGIPVTSQWNRKGYFYAIQISQFGLSHYSKNVLEKPVQYDVYENGENGIKSKWKTTNHHCTVKTVFDSASQSNVVKFSTPATMPLGSGAILTLGGVNKRLLSFDVKFVTNGSLSVVVETYDKKKQYVIHYVTTDLLVDADKHSNVFYGIGECKSWKHLARNLEVDLMKALQSKGNSKAKVKLYKISRIILRGDGFIDNVTISKTAHMTHFRDACSYLVESQDAKTGGWINHVTKPFTNSFDPLPPGWTSAMGQGQALSLLTRGYFVYGDKQYIRTMSRALGPFTVSSEKGGVRAMFLNTHVWYEEYPTTPSSFVLNGFIFSLFGLHDFKSLLEDKFDLHKSSQLPDTVADDFAEIGVDLVETYRLVSRLHDEGFTSLKAMLPLYDGGTRTFYDLRHIAFKIQPNIARWDYHTVHLSQLAVLSSMSDDPIFKRYFSYWHGYMKGKVAAHN